MKMTNSERMAEKIAVMLLTLELPLIQHIGVNTQEQLMELVSNEAIDMATRIGRKWYTIPGKPYFNERMASLLEKLKARKKAMRKGKQVKKARAR